MKNLLYNPVLDLDTKEDAVYTNNGVQGEEVVEASGDQLGNKEGSKSLQSRPPPEFGDFSGPII